MLQHGAAIRFYVCRFLVVAEDKWAVPIMGWQVSEQLLTLAARSYWFQQKIYRKLTSFFKYHSTLVWTLSVAQPLLVWHQVKNLCGDEGQLGRLRSDLIQLNTTSQNLESKMKSMKPGGFHHTEHYKYTRCVLLSGQPVVCTLSLCALLRVSLPESHNLKYPTETQSHDWC